MKCQDVEYTSYPTNLQELEEYWYRKGVLKGKELAFKEIKSELHKEITRLQHLEEGFEYYESRIGLQRQRVGVESSYDKADKLLRKVRQEIKKEERKEK